MKKHEQKKVPKSHENLNFFNLSHDNYDFDFAAQKPASNTLKPWFKESSSSCKGESAIDLYTISAVFRRVF